MTVSDAMKLKAEPHKTSGKMTLWVDWWSEMYSTGKTKYKDESNVAKGRKTCEYMMMTNEPTLEETAMMMCRSDKMTKRVWFMCIL